MSRRAARHLTILLSLLALAAHTRRSEAQGDAGSRTLAVQLFDEAEALYAKAEVARACPKYAESFRLDPQLGVLIYLAECYEKNNQLASAWGTFRQAEEMAAKRGDERQAHAHERALALDARLDRLTLKVPASSRVPGLEILRDGLPIAATLWNTGAVLDAGTHRISARAPGYLPWSAQIEVVGEATAIDISVPTLQLDTSKPTAGDSDYNPGASSRIAAIALGGVGLVGLGVGGFFGLSAQASFSDSRPLCSDEDICTSRGTELRNQAKSKALVSTVTASVGVAGLVSAAVLWFTAPNRGHQEKNARAARITSIRATSSASAYGVEVSAAF
jgi:hypothetical protein